MSAVAAPGALATAGSAAGFALVGPEAMDAAAWRALAGATALPNPYLAPEFADAAARFVGARGLKVAHVAEGRELGALLPVVSDRPWRRRAWTHPYAPLGNPLARPGALSRLLVGLATDRALTISHVTGETAFAALREAADTAGLAVAVVDEASRATALRETWRGDAELSRSRRKELRRLARRLADLGPVSWHTATTIEAVRTGFAAFVALEASGWKGRRQTALASRTGTLQFRREAVTAAAARCSARIDSLDVGGRPAAMLVSLVAGDTLFAWKMAYREELAALSPGVQLMLGLPARVFDETPCASIDSCADPDNAMINTLWAERLPVRHLVIGRPGARFMAARELERVEVRTRALLRRLKR